MKRLLYLFLIMTMLLTLGAVPALADELPEGEEPQVLLLGVAGWDITGDWTFAFEPADLAMPAMLTLSTADSASGEVSAAGEFGGTAYTVTGQVTGDSVGLDYANGEYTVSLDGTVTATGMSGTWSDNLEGSGTWSASGSATQLATAPFEGFAWLAPVRLEGKPVRVGANLTIKFRYGAPATDVIEEPEVETEEVEGAGEEEVLEVVDSIPSAELKIYLAGADPEIISPKRCGDSGILLAHLRPEAAGEYTVEAYLDGVLLGSISFAVAEKGPHGMGQAKGKAGEQGQATSRNLVKENNRDKNKGK